MRVLVVAALALALVACGGRAAKPLTAAQVKHCSVRVFFAHNATPGEEHAVGSKLRADANVTRVSFVSKAKAFARMKKAEPDIFNSLPKLPNPLPDSYIAVPKHLSDSSQIGSSIAHAHGVANVMTGSKLFCES